MSYAYPVPIIFTILQAVLALQARNPARQPVLPTNELTEFELYIMHNSNSMTPLKCTLIFP